MFLWISLNSCPLNLLLVQSHQAEIIIVKRLIQGRNNVTRVRVEPRPFDQGRHKNDAFTHSATLPTKFTLCTKVLPPQRGGAVPSPMGMGRNGRTDLQRGSTKRLPPLSRTVFSLGRSLTGHNWAAPLLLIDRTPFSVSLSWHCSLLVAMSTLTQAPSATILTPGTPAPSDI